MRMYIKILVHTNILAEPEVKEKQNQDQNIHIISVINSSIITDDYGVHTGIYSRV